MEPETSAFKRVAAAYELVELDELAARVPPRTSRRSRRKTRSDRVRSVERPARQRRAAGLNRSKPRFSGGCGELAR